MEYRRSTCGRVCEVCCEEVESGSLAGCAKCAHRYCVTCVRRYWETQIFSGSHGRLACLHGGCGVSATESDICSVVSLRAYRRMLYFRARDKNSEAKFCPFEPCWALLPGVTASVGDVSITTCDECTRDVCTHCEQPWTQDHQCTTPKGRGVFASRVWAVTHTKACPSCGARIQRARGCAHMTCARCAAYFCWRCRGFLHNDCNRGRTCVCDRLLTGAAYGGLAAVAVIGAPVIITGAILGGAPWLVYRMVKRKQQRANSNDEEGALPPFNNRSTDESYDDLARFIAARTYRNNAIPLVLDNHDELRDARDGDGSGSGSGAGAGLRRRNTK